MVHKLTDLEHADILLWLVLREWPRMGELVISALYSAGPLLAAQFGHELCKPGE